MRSLFARHTCTTYRNQAPCERDQNCTWVNPHPRGMRTKHKFLHLFTGDVKDPLGRCESKRASHASRQRPAGPSESASETDLSSEPESFSPATSDFEEDASALPPHASISPRRAGLEHLEPVSPGLGVSGEPRDGGSPRNVHGPERRSELPDGGRSNDAKSQGPLAKPHSPRRALAVHQAPLVGETDSESESSDEESPASVHEPQHYEKSVPQRKAEREAAARKLAETKREEELRIARLHKGRSAIAPAKKWGTVATNFGPQKGTAQQQSILEATRQEHALQQASLAEARRQNVAAAKKTLQARWDQQQASLTPEAVGQQRASPDKPLATQPGLELHMEGS